MCQSTLWRILYWSFQFFGAWDAHKVKIRINHSFWQVLRSRWTSRVLYNTWIIFIINNYFLNCGYLHKHNLKPPSNLWIQVFSFVFCVVVSTTQLTSASNALLCGIIQKIHIIINFFHSNHQGIQNGINTIEDRST